MPEAPINKHSESLSPEDKICATPEGLKWSLIYAIAKSSTMDLSTEG
jgi:hypothetical protein